MDFSLLVEKLNLQIKSYQVINLHFDTFTFAVLNITTKYKCIFEK